MDILQDYAMQAINLYINASSTSTASSSSTTSTTEPPYPNIPASLSNYISTLQPLLTPLLPPLLTLKENITTHLSSSPLLYSFISLLLILFGTLQLMNLARRLLFWFVRLVLRVVFWGCVVLVGIRVAQRGVGESLADVVGWGEEVYAVWLREYRRWEGVGRSAGGGGVGAAGKRW